MTKPSKSDLFRAAHAKARIIHGQRAIATAYRDAFRIALKAVYQAEREAVERKAAMDASIAKMKADAAQMIRANLERRLSAATQARIVAEHDDTIGGHRRINAAIAAERRAVEALRAAI